MKKVYSICEYEYFTREKETEDSKYYPLPGEVFDLLLESIVSYPTKEAEIQTLFLITQKRKFGTVIQAMNYVGTFLLKNGVSIEILPKIADNHTLHCKSRKVFLQMLRDVYDFPIKKLEEASLYAEKNGIFEWFITLFLRETENLVRQGLCLEYNLKESNEPFLKGKLLFSKHITNNLIHREYFYIEKDVFNEDRPENRLIKAALLEVNKIAGIKNKRKIKRLLSYLYYIEPSFQVEKDIVLCKKDRNSEKYNTVLEWCKIFLNRKRFSIFYGNDKFLSLFFAMDKLFERYMAKQIYDTFHKNQCIVKTQLRGTYLLERKRSNTNASKNYFELVPDIAVRTGEQLVLLDTKWKLLMENRKNYGISQDDIYQMFVYGVCYQAEKVLMLYPKREEIQEEIVFSSKSNLVIKVIWVDLFDINETMERIRKELE